MTTILSSGARMVESKGWDGTIEIEMQVTSRECDVDACSRALDDVIRALRETLKTASKEARKKHGVKIEAELTAEFFV